MAATPEPHSISLRIREFKERKKIKDVQFYGAIGISRQAFEKIERGERVPSYQTIAAMVAKYPEMNPTWLLTGVGEMLVESSSITASMPVPGIPLYSSYNSIAGVLKGVEATSQIGSLMVSGVRADCAIVVSGNSMEPRYHPGDYVLLRESRPDYIEYGQPYVIELATGDVLLKVLRNSDTKHVILESENRALYSPMVVERKDIERLYKVIGMFRKEAQ